VYVYVCVYIYIYICIYIYIDRFAVLTCADKSLYVNDVM